jgi:hypothetical protein
MEMDWKEKYAIVGSFYEGRAMVRINRKYGYVDKHGNEVIAIKYDKVGNFQEGRAWVRLNRKYGFVDLQGDVLIPLKYDWISIFHNNKADIQISNCWGQIDLNGKEYFSTEDRAKLRKAKVQRLLKDL